MGYMRDADGVRLDGVSVVSQLNASGVTTAAQVSAWLAAPSPLGVKRLVGNLTINAPIVIPSNTRLDASGSTITLLAGSNCNLLQNTAVTAQRAVTDASATAGSATVTSATANFAAGDVGHTLVVAGASGSSNGYAPLVGLIAAVNSATSVTLSVAAQATVTNAAASVYTRDTNIRVVGGTWARGANAGTGTALHSLLFRHIDGLTIDVHGISSTAGKYAISVGDCTDIDATVRGLNTASDGLHLNGPIDRANIRLVAGTTGDDMLALTASDYSAYQDVAGNITNVSIGTLLPNNAKEALKVLAGNGFTVDNVRVGAVFGTTYNSVAWIGDDTSLPNTQGGTYGYIDCGLIAAAPAAGSYLLVLPSPTASHIRAQLSDRRTAGTPIALYHTGATTSTIGLLELTGCEFAAPGNALSLSSTNATVQELMLDNCRYAPVSGTSSMLYLHAGSFRKITFRNCTHIGTAGGYTLNADGGTADHVVVDGGYYSSGNNLIHGAAATPARITLTGGVTITSFGRVLSLYNTASTTLVELVAAQFNSINLAAIYSSANGANIVIRGGTLTPGSGALILVGASGTGTVEMLAPTIPVDISLLTAKARGDMAYNSNSGLSCGIGPVIYTGTNWKSLVDGTTY